MQHKRLNCMNSGKGRANENKADALQVSELVKFADGGEYKFATHPDFIDAPTWLWSESKSRTLSAPTRTWQTGSRSRSWTSRPGQMDVYCCHVLFIIFAIFAV